MVKRLIIAALVVGALGGLIAYSKYRPTPDWVSGFIEADEIRIGSRVGGRVEKVFVEEGQRIEVGDVLIELEPFDLVQQAKEAEATLAAREAEYQQLKSGLRPEEVGQAQAHYEQLQSMLDELVAGPRQEEFEAAQAELRVSEAQQRLAQINLGRIRRLMLSNAATQEDLDRATEAMDVAEGAVALQQARLRLLEAGTRKEEIDAARSRAKEAQLAAQLAEKGYRSEEIAKAKAARDAAQAALAAINDRIAELSIKSPVEGTVEALDLQPGDLVSPNAPILSLMDTRRLWVRAYVPENRINIRVGQKTSVSVDSYPEKRFNAEFTFVSRQAEFTPSNIQTPEERSKQVFRVKVSLTEGLDQLRPGMAADVWLSDIE